MKICLLWQMFQALCMDDQWQPSVGLAIYFAERNKGDYHNRFMTFSALPSIVHLEGETLAEKVACAVEADWGLNTNLEEAFDSILKTAVENHVPEEEMPKSLIIISDMEFDSATYDSDWLFYETMKKKFKRNGYTGQCKKNWRLCVL